MKRVRAKFVGCQAILWALVFFMVLPALRVLAAKDVNSGGSPDGNAPSFYFEPIAGLTTERHLAPSRTAIPLGTELRLFLPVDWGLDVTISGAVVTSRDTEGVSAACILDREGLVTIRAVTESSNGASHTTICRLDVVSISVADIVIRVAEPRVAPFDLDETATNAETMARYFSGRSIASCESVSPPAAESESGEPGPRVQNGQRIEKWYRTSTNRFIGMHVDINHPELLPLMEWRVNGVADSLGEETRLFFVEPGTKRISVGPTQALGQLNFEIYEVFITSHVSQEDFVEEGEWIMFQAVTNPPGFEDSITWLSSTKYGTGAPVRGQGATFTVQFDNTWGDHPTNGYFQWLGLRADNARFNQDGKTTLVCGVRDEGGLMVAFIGLSDGADFVSVGFDPGTFEEDFTTQRFFGLNEMELEDWENIGNSSLLTHPLAAPAGGLWQTGLPCDGTAEELALLSRQSQLLIIMLDSIGAPNPQREFAGCTLVPAFNFEDCCDTHDDCYAAGGDGAARKLCDQAFRDWIIDERGRPILGHIYYWGVRAFGWLFF